MYWEKSTWLARPRSSLALSLAAVGVVRVAAHARGEHRHILLLTEVDLVTVGGRGAGLGGARQVETHFHTLFTVGGHHGNRHVNLLGPAVGPRDVSEEIHEAA